MSLLGHIQNGMVVFDQPVSLPEGTKVRVQPIAPGPADFWHGSSVDELAEQQGVVLPGWDEDAGGGWPEDELDDGFEAAVVMGRLRELLQ